MLRNHGDCDDRAEGPWNPGIRSTLTRELLARSTIFRPENVRNDLTRAMELRVNRDTLTVEGVARKLGLTAQTVRSYLAEERLPGRKIGKRWQVNEVELDAWIADGRMDAVPAHERVEATRRSVARAQDLRDGYGPSF